MNGVYRSDQCVVSVNGTAVLNSATRTAFANAVNDSFNGIAICNMYKVVTWFRSNGVAGLDFAQVEYLCGVLLTYVSQGHVVRNISVFHNAGSVVLQSGQVVPCVIAIV